MLYLGGIIFLNIIRKSGITNKSNMNIELKIKKSIIGYILCYYKHGLFPTWPLFKIRRQFPLSYIAPRAKVHVNNPNLIYIGENSVISDFSYIVVRGLKKDTFLEIGDYTYIGEFNNIRAAGGKITIGNNCLISQHISIICSNHGIRKDQLIRTQEWQNENNEVVIGDDVWIGANSVILPGVHIGNGVVVGAGSVVTKDIPTNAIVVGNPARVIKFRE